MKKRNLMLLSAIAAASILMTGCGFTADDPADSQAVTITPEPTDYTGTYSYTSTYCYPDSQPDNYTCTGRNRCFFHNSGRWYNNRRNCFYRQQHIF